MSPLPALNPNVADGSTSPDARRHPMLRIGAVRLVARGAPAPRAETRLACACVEVAIIVDHDEDGDANCVRCGRLINAGHA